MLCTISGPLWDEWLWSKFNGPVATDLSSDEGFHGKCFSYEGVNE